MAQFLKKETPEKAKTKKRIKTTWRFLKSPRSRPLF